jgi:hypothetical protein
MWQSGSPSAVSLEDPEVKSHFILEIKKYVFCVGMTDNEKPVITIIILSWDS